MSLSYREERDPDFNRFIRFSDSYIQQRILDLLRDDERKRSECGVPMTFRSHPETDVEMLTSKGGSIRCIVCGCEILIGEKIVHAVDEIHLTQFIEQIYQTFGERDEWGNIVSPYPDPENWRTAAQTSDNVCHWACP